jgi:hypothetical protein
MVAVYYLLRWIAPLALPKELRDLELPTATLMCFVPVLIWTGISEGLRRRGAPGVSIGIFAQLQIPVGNTAVLPKRTRPM